MNDSTENPVRLACLGGAMIIQPPQCGTAVVAQAVHRFLESDQASSVDEFYVDLSQTSRLDSTFAGMLLTLKGGKKCGGRREVHLVQPTEQALAALDGMHLRRLFDICDGLPATPERWHSLQVEEHDAAQLCDLIIEAHKEICIADSRNRAAFAPVIDSFEAERSRRRDDSNPG